MQFTLKQLAYFVAAGEAAPDFTLPDDAGSSQSLSAQRGRWVVLFFYPKADTGG